MKSFFGYCLTGERSAQMFLVLYGPVASNGKSTICEMFKTCLPIYSKVLDRQTFNSGYQKAHKQLIQIGTPIRFCYIEELDRHKEINVTLLKDAVTADVLPVEVMYGTTAAVKLHTKFALLSNPLPKFEGDNGIARRGNCAELKNQFKTDEEIKRMTDREKLGSKIYKKDPDMIQRFDEKKKLAYINMLLPYAKSFYENKSLYIPACIKQAFTDIVDENDVMKQFLDNHVEVTGDDHDKINKVTFERLYNQKMKTKETFSQILGSLKRHRIKYVKDASHKSIKGVIYGLKEKAVTLDEKDEKANANIDAINAVPKRNDPAIVKKFAFDKAELGDSLDKAQFGKRAKNPPKKIEEEKKDDGEEIEEVIVKPVKKVVKEKKEKEVKEKAESVKPIKEKKIKEMKEEVKEEVVKPVAKKPKGKAIKVAKDVEEEDDPDMELAIFKK